MVAYKILLSSESCQGWGGRSRQSLSLAEKNPVCAEQGMNTCILMYRYILVGDLEHEFYDFPYIGNKNPNWRTHIFQRGWHHPPVHIYVYIYTYIYIYHMYIYIPKLHIRRICTWYTYIQYTIKSGYIYNYNYIHTHATGYTLHYNTLWYILHNIWVNYNDLTTTSLEIMVSKGNHPQMALIQVSEIL